MQMGSPSGITARCRMVRDVVSTSRSPPVNDRRNMSMAELEDQFKKLPLKAFGKLVLHIRLVAVPTRSKRL